MGKILRFINEFFIMPNKFPKMLFDEWFAYNAIPHKRRQEGERHDLVPYWDSTGSYINYNREDIVPMKRIGNYVAFYKIEKIKRPYGDYAGWDDGRKYDLIFIHCKFHPEKIGDEVIYEKQEV
jgi:hypothetical protein